MTGTAFVIKGEPSATDTTLLQRTLTAEQKAELGRIIRARLRSYRPRNVRG